MMTDKDILDQVVSSLRLYVIDNEPMSPGAIRSLLNGIDRQRTERRETPVSATIRPA